MTVRTFASPVRLQLTGQPAPPRETNPWHELYLQTKQRYKKSNPAKSAVARKVLIAAWHVLSREEPFKPSRRHSGGSDPVPASSLSVLAA